MDAEHVIGAVVTGIWLFGALLYVIWWITDILDKP
ncbi:hypothetical protein [Mycobacterium phage WXIN]|nr:hypothetical protein [Mycobacterium phage WXIN]